MKINNRRYIGCKTKLLDFIFSTVSEINSDNKYQSFADIFAGTGVVGSYFASQGYKTILNDNLYHNTIIYEALLSIDTLDLSKIKQIINELNCVDSSLLADNYFSEVYGDKYYSINDAKKIGYIRDYIENLKGSLSRREYCYLIASLIYASDKIANTVGHFESFLSKKPIDKGVVLPILDVVNTKYGAEIYNMDANVLAKQITSDIVYIDPPYNARQYVNFYHVLENLARWNKPTEFEGNSMKFKRQSLKSDYCKNRAPALFEDLIMSLDCKLIVVSYNNTYRAGSTSSVNTISAEQLISILSNRGTVTVRQQDYRAFNAGKTVLEGHKECLYVCEVNK